MALDDISEIMYGRTSVARTLIARLPCLRRTRSWDPIYETSVRQPSAFMFSCCYFHFLFLVAGGTVSKNRK